MKKTFIPAAVYSGIILTAVCGLCSVSAKTYDIPKITGFAQVEEIPANHCKSVSEETGTTNNEEIFSEDVKLIALLTAAEAEGESEKGQRLVIDTVLNRVDSEHFPDTVYDVIYQPRQFSPMWNGRAERCSVSDDICRLVAEEMEYRTDNSVIFFTAGGYSRYGAPMYKEGNHYFSSYD